jgi:hypothetical protein
MKKLYIIPFLLLGCAINGFAQNLRFSYQVINPTDTTSKLIISVHRSVAGTENIRSFNFGFYYKSSEATVIGYLPGATDPEMNGAELNCFDGSYAAALGWTPFFNGSIEAVSSPPGLPSGYDRICHGALLDNLGVGSNIGTTPVQIVSLTLRHNLIPLSEAVMDSAYQANSVTNPPYTYSNIDLDEFAIILTGPQLQPLPIKLIDFSAEKSGEKSAMLNWSSASESNSSYFGIERSKDKVKWTNVGQVAAAGNSQIILNYQYLDKDVYSGVSSNLTVYYRLKMVDLDGSFSYSPIESVKFGNSSRDVVDNADDFVVYPNPASEGIHVEWDIDQVKQPTSLEFYDLSGKLVYTEKVEEQTDQKYVDFTKTNIQSGLVLMRVLSGDETINYQQIVVGKSY